MKRISILAFILFYSINSSIAQQRKPIFIGFQPGITQEKFYEKDEFDVNVIPVVFQIPLNKHIDLRFTTIGNYHFGGEENGFSDLGFQVLAPYFLKKKESTHAISKGFYIAPVGGYGRNLINDHGTYVLAAEAGYLFPTSRSFTLSLGIQFGGSYFDYDEEPDLWRQHFGFKINLGFWTRTK